LICCTLAIDGQWRSPNNSLRMFTPVRSITISYWHSYLHSRTEVVGIDMVPIQSRMVPPNCSFQIADLNDGLPFGVGSFDVVHLRFAQSGVSVSLLTIEKGNNGTYVAPSVCNPACLPCPPIYRDIPYPTSWRYLSLSRQPSLFALHIVLVFFVSTRNKRVSGRIR
jgi:hypothetical protein